MATIEDELGYKIAEKYLTKKYGNDFVDFMETEGQSYLDGYEQGYEDCRRYAHDYYKPKWHDLREDPSDLPKHNNQIVVAFAFNTNTNQFYCFDFANYFDGFKSFITHTSDGNNINNGKKVIAWCDFMRFGE